MPKPSSTLPTLAASLTTGAQRIPVPRSHGWPAARIGLALAAVALAMLAAVAVSDLGLVGRVAPGVVVLDVSVGGLSRAEAAARLEPNVAALLDHALEVRSPTRTWTARARDLGLRLDPGELAAAAYQVGRTGSPGDRLTDRLEALLRGHAISLDGTLDQAALDAALATIARDIERSPRDAKVALRTDGSVAYTAGLNGVVVDQPASREQIARALASGATSVDLVARETPPTIPDEAVQPAKEQIERLLGDGRATPLILTFGGKSWPLERTTVVQLLSLQGGTSAAQPARVQVDEQSLKALAASLARDIDQRVQDARFNVVDGQLKVIRESKEGRELDQAATIQLIKEQLLAGGRVAALPVSVVRPQVASDDGPKLGIAERIETARTSFAGSIPEKQWNIQLAAERLNGVVVPPGGTFSFNKEVGPTTLEAGFKWGFGIEAGSNGGAKTVPSVAGGICQVATTLFQPVFWAGYQLEERYWHLYWIPAYTSKGVVGLDATVDEDTGLDLRWTNTTRDYVLIQSATDGSNVYFSLYGTKPTWKVEVDEPQIANRRPASPQPVAQAEPTLPWGRTLQVESARDGFDVSITRRVTPAAGGEPRTLKLRSSYQPSRTVTLVGTAGKPANASVEEALARVLGPPRPSEPQAQENKPVGDAATPVEENPSEPASPAPPAATTAPAVGAPATPGPRPTPTPLPRR